MVLFFKKKNSTLLTPQYDRTRSFYHQCDYTEEARIRDFYQEGESKVVFWKRL